jgi:hypothetical protein
MGTKVRIEYSRNQRTAETKVFPGDEMGEGAAYDAIQFLEDLTVGGPVTLVDVMTIDSGEDFEQECEEEE